MASGISLMPELQGFINIMQIATYGMELYKWGEKELMTVLSWVVYWQKKIKGMSMKMQRLLSKEMLNTNQALERPLLFNFTASNLQIAPDHLFQALAYNPSLSAEGEQTLETKFKKYVSLDLPAFVSFKVIRKYAVETANALKDMQTVLNSMQSTSDDVYNAMINLLEQLTLFLMLTPESRHFDMWLNNVLLLWTRCPRGWYVLITSMSTDLRREEKDKRKTMKKLFIKFLTWIHTQHLAYGQQCGVWELSPAQLADLCGYNDNFAEWYIKRLRKMGDHLNTRLQKNNRDLWESLVQCAKNPFEEVDHPELNELEDRLGQLVIKGGKVKASTLNMILDKVYKNDNTLWNYISLQVYKKYTAEE